MLSLNSSTTIGSTGPDPTPSAAIPLPSSPELSPLGYNVLPLTTPTILLAEDDDDLRYVMTYFLETLHLHVIACSNAESASAIFHSKVVIDMLITDLQMPGRSGIDLARELTAAHPSLPILIVSGSTLSLDLVTEINDRGWTFHSKPCQLSMLVLTINNLLNLESKMAA